MDRHRNIRLAPVLYCALFLELVALPLLLTAAPPVPPDIDPGAVIERYLEAVGGKDALAKLQSRVLKGTFNLPDMGLQAPVTSYVKAPGLSLTAIDFADYGSATSGTKEGIAWEINPMMGPRLIQGGDKAAFLRRAQIEPLEHWKTTFPEVQSAGEGMIGTAQCDKIVLTPAEGTPVTYWFDRATGLATRLEGMAGGIPVRTELSDYREVDGIKIPFRALISGMQFTFEIAWDSVEHNVEIPAEKFDFPPEIKTLLQPAP